MNAEGLARIISPEVVQATATGPLLWAVAWGMWLALGVLWRRTVWMQHRDVIIAFAAAHQGQIHGVPFGWRVDAGARSVEWRFGPVDGPVTRLLARGRVESRPGWLLLADVERAVDPPSPPS